MPYRSAGFSAPSKKARLRPDEDRDAVAEKLGILAKQLDAKELARARTLVDEISAAVMRHQQSRKARSDSSSPTPNIL
jgi:hypothetical protein